MLGQFEFYWFFHGLMISEKNINKHNTKCFTRSCSWTCCSSVFTKKTCVLSQICCALLAFIFPDLIWCWWHIIKQVFHAYFCLMSKLFTLGNIIFNSTSRRWILVTLSEKFLILNRKACNICSLTTVNFNDTLT